MQLDVRLLKPLYTVQSCGGDYNMALSNEIIAQFVKATNDVKKEKTKKTMYGTIKERDGSFFVQIDGSEILTPFTPTVAAKDGERVTVKISDHTVIVSGNVTSPAARDSDVQELGKKIGEFDLVIADKVSTKDLEAERARIDKIVAKKADIDLANVNNAWIQNGIIKDGSIGDAAIHDGAITNAKIADATIEAAKIKSVNADTISAGTIKTKLLIITGPDGEESIVKAINMANGVPEAEVNSQQIQAASIDVVDLSAFQAKIAGFDMSGNAIYSGKESIKDPNSGIYISTTGIGMGDGSLTGKNEAPMQAYADGSFKLVGKNSGFDFNAVTGELNIEATKLKISSKSVAIKDDVDDIRRDLGELVTNTTEFSQTVEGWQLKWDTLIQTDQANIKEHQKYITFQNGDIILGESASKTKLTLSKEDIEFTDTNGNTKATFGDTVRLGNQTNRNLEIDSGGIIIKNQSDVIAKIGYGEGYDNEGVKRNVAYYTFGTRVDESAIGMYSVAEGKDIIASGSTSHAEGYNTTASDTTAHAEGFQTTASGNSAHSEGYGSIASGDSAHAEGQFTEAKGIGSHASGRKTKAYSAYQTVIGRCNIADSAGKCLFIVGNGGENTPSNAFVVNDTGSIEVERGVWIGSNNQGLNGLFTDKTSAELALVTSGNMLRYGYGAYEKGNCQSGLYGGNGIVFGLKTPNITWNPYYKPGDSITVDWFTAGYITNSGMELQFCFQPALPIIGCTAVSISSVDGFRVRQGAKYLYRSSASNMVKAKSLIGLFTRNVISIKADMGSDSNVQNNSPCGIQASLKFTFS